MNALNQETIALPAIAGSVAEGLLRIPKSLPPWLFYDAEGSRLFEEITALPEYYLTRTEHAILEDSASEMLGLAGQNLALIELGAGTATKTGTLIRALLRRQLRVDFYPVDVSPSALEIAQQSLSAVSRQVRVHPIVADYTHGLLDVAGVAGRKLALYLGSSIGNFEPAEAATVLRQLRSCLQDGDALLLGTDLPKHRGVLEPAYNDHAGVTARFNKNLLVRINRELGGHFDLRHFRHIAQWDAQHSRMEMYLISEHAQNIAIDALGACISFFAGERIHTENSYKYTTETTDSLLRAGGFARERTWTDPRQWFAVHLARAMPR